MEKNDLYGTQITLLVGDAGSGKTFFALNHPDREKGFFLDLEHRYQETMKFHPEIPVKQLILNSEQKWGVMDEKNKKFVECPPNKVILGTYTNCLVYTKDFDVDPVKTFDCVDSFVKRAISSGVKLLVIDGVQDLRRMATEKYEAESGKTAYGMQAFGKINSMVKTLLYRAFNFARLNNIQVLITTHYAPEYNETGDRTGKVYVDAKDYIVDRVDEILGFKRSESEFTIRRGKSPKGPCEPVDWSFTKEGEESE